MFVALVTITVVTTNKQTLGFSLFAVTYFLLSSHLWSYGVTQVGPAQIVCINYVLFFWKYLHHVAKVETQ